MSVGGDGLPQRVTARAASTLHLTASDPAITSHHRLRYWNQWKLLILLTLPYCHSNSLRRSVVSHSAHGNIWLKAKVRSGPYLFSLTGWCEAKVQTFGNISSWRVFIWPKPPAPHTVRQIGKALWEVLPSLKWEVRVVLRQKRRNLKQPHPPEILQVCLILTGSL